MFFFKFVWFYCLWKTIFLDRAFFQSLHHVLQFCPLPIRWAFVTVVALKFKLYRLYPSQAKPSLEPQSSAFLLLFSRRFSQFIAALLWFYAVLETCIRQMKIMLRKAGSGTRLHYTHARELLSQFFVFIPLLDVAY